jgi:hypothetical protein
MSSVIGSKRGCRGALALLLCLVVAGCAGAAYRSPPGSQTSQLDDEMFRASRGSDGGGGGSGGM